MSGKIIVTKTLFTTETEIKFNEFVKIVNESLKDYPPEVQESATIKTELYGYYVTSVETSVIINLLETDEEYEERIKKEEEYRSKMDEEREREQYEKLKMKFGNKDE